MPSLVEVTPPYLVWAVGKGLKLSFHKFNTSVGVICVYTMDPFSGVPDYSTAVCSYYLNGLKVLCQGMSACFTRRSNVASRGQLTLEPV